MGRSKETIHRIEEFELPDSSFLEGLVLMECIQSPDLIPTVRRYVRAETFSDEHLRNVWSKVMALWDAKADINLASILQPLEKSLRSRLMGYMADSMFSYGVAVESHALSLVSMAVRRKCYFAAMRVLQDSSREGTDPLSAMEDFAKEIRQDAVPTDTSVTLQEAFGKYAEQLEEESALAVQGRAIRVGMGMPSLDRILAGGFNKGELVILAARPSTGKTALMLQMAEHAARIGYPGIIFSLEMTVEQLAKRMLLSKERLNVGDINRGRVDWDKFSASESDFVGVDILIDDNAKTSLEDIEAKLTVLCQQGKVRIAFIDYLQLMHGGDEGGRKSLNQVIGDRTAALKRLAKSCGIPIVLLSQLNRSSAINKVAPQLTDLRDSGNIEQDADTVIMLDPHEGVGIDVWIRKNRNGIRDVSVTLQVNSTYTRFSEYQGDCNFPQVQ